MIQKIKSFLTTDIWCLKLKTLPGSKAWLIRQLRVILLGIRGFSEDKCLLSASALTFFSLLSIVPIVAMAFGIAKGFGFEKLLEKQLNEGFRGQEEVIAKIIDFAQVMLNNTHGGLIAGIGIAVLFWTVIKVLSNIEMAFNDIWGIKVPRTLLRKFSDYLAIMLICPVLLIVSSSITVFVVSQFTTLVAKLSFLGPLSSILLFVIKLLPYAVVWVLFSFIYIMMPNTRVHFTAGLFGGIIGGTIYQVVQWIYITFQIGASNYGAIYGSFAALPLFLIWLQMSWLVVLFGAELSFAHQNVDTYEFEPDCLSVSPRFKRLLSLQIMQVLVKNFVEGKPPLTANQLSHELEIPIRLLNELLFDLVKSGLLSPVKKDDPRITAYQPGKDPNVMTVKFVLDAMENCGIDKLPTLQSPHFKKLQASLHNFSTLVEKSPDNILLRQM